MASTALVTLGHHAFGAEHPEWDRVNALGPSPIIAFSRTPIEACFERDAPVTLTSAVAATPPARSRYVRAPRSSQGHNVVWCMFNRPDELSRAVALRRPAALDHPDSPFGRSAVPASPLAGMLARRAAHAALDAPQPCDPTELEEAVVLIVELLTGDLAGLRAPPPPGSRAAAREVVNDTAAVLASRFADPPTLGALAQRAGVSAAYLSRVFRQQTGVTLSVYTALVRLAEAAELLRDRRCSVARAAFACGFASHAHLTATSTRRLGVTPSAIAGAHRERLSAMLRLVRSRAGR